MRDLDRRGVSGVVRIGTSGFGYEGWRGGFYPKRLRASDMLAFYAGRLPTVEINYTFRRRLTPAAVARWRDSVGEDFRFAVKASFAITHWRRLVDAAEEVRSFLETLDPLGDRLGPILFQTPGNLLFDEQVVAGFLRDLPAGRQYVFEPLHRSFRDGRFAVLLAAHEVVRCINDDHDELPSPELLGAADAAYLRFRRHRYSAGDLAARAALVAGAASRGADVYVYFRHTETAAAPRAARAFGRLVATVGAGESEEGMR